MTVFRPSLPPESSTTTRTVSLPCSAAWAVRARKPGTAGPTARSVEALRKSRRFSMRPLSAGIVGFLCQVILGSGDQCVGGLADAPHPVRVLGRSVGEERGQFRSGLGREITVQEQVGQQFHGRAGFRALL